MTAKEAYVIVKKDFKDMHVYGCREYKDMYVFNICQEKDKELLPKVRGFMWAINKNTRKGKTFKPLDMTPEEYRKGREVKHFK